MARLVNNAIAEGTLDGTLIDDSSQVVVFTSAILIEKTADRVLWDNDDELTYTVDISNADPADPASTIENAVFRDVIDPAIAELVANSVMNGATVLTPAVDAGNPQIGEYAYIAETGLLTIPLGNLDKGNDIRITFRVSKKA